MISNTKAQTYAKLYTVAASEASVSKLLDLTLLALQNLGQEMPTLELRPWHDEIIESRVEIRSWHTREPMIYGEIYLTADFDELLGVLPPSSDIDLEHLSATWKEYDYVDGIMHCIQVHVRAEADPDYLDQLRNLGKIKMHSDHYTNTYESIACDL